MSAQPLLISPPYSPLRTRRSRRVSCAMHVTLERSHEVCQGITRDVSRNGVLLDVEAQLRPGEFCVLGLLDEGASERLVLSGRVVRSLSSSCHALHLFGHEPETQQRWEQLLTGLVSHEQATGALPYRPTLRALLRLGQLLSASSAPAPLWMALGRPAPLDVPFKLIVHHPDTASRFELSARALSNKTGHTLLCFEPLAHAQRLALSRFIHAALA